MSQQISGDIELESAPFGVKAGMDSNFWSGTVILKLRRPIFQTFNHPIRFSYAAFATKSSKNKSSATAMRSATSIKLRNILVAIVANCS